MKASYSTALDEDWASCTGGHYGIQVYFDDESDSIILAKVKEALASVHADKGPQSEKYLKA